MKPAAPEKRYADLCPLCRGMGSTLTATKSHGYEWWTCAPCGGSGVRVQYGPTALHAPERVLP